MVDGHLSCDITILEGTLTHFVLQLYYYIITVLQHDIITVLH